MASDAPCPIKHAASGGNSNRDWWPNQLNLGILHQHSSKSEPMGAGFNYAKEFKSLDFKALKDLLTKTKNKPGYDTDALKQAAHNFLESKDEFHRKQGHPLRFWANNISAFLPRLSGRRETPEYLN